MVDVKSFVCTENQLAYTYCIDDGKITKILQVMCSLIQYINNEMVIFET